MTTTRSEKCSAARRAANEPSIGPAAPQARTRFEAEASGPGAGMKPAHDLRLVPVAAVTWLGAWIGVSGWRPDTAVLIPVAAAIVLLAIISMRARRWWLAVCLLSLLCAGLAAGVRSAALHESPVAAMAAKTATGAVTFDVRAPPRVFDDTVAVDATLTSATARGTRIEGATPVVILGVGEGGRALLGLRVGAEYAATARLGGADRDEPIPAVLSLRSVPEEISAPGPLQAGAAALREGLRRSMSHSPPGQAALVPSLVVGDTSAVNEATREQFRATGLTHLMAVSGANLSLMMGVLLTVVRACSVRGWAVRCAAAASVVGFVLLCGAEPSVLRAAAMGLVAVAAMGVGRGRRSLRGLSLAVFALLWTDPWLASSAGFGLSVCACAGIVLVGPKFLESLCVWCPRWVAEALAIPLAAQLATQPLVTAISGQVSVVGVLANVLAGPFVGPTTVLGFAAAMLTPVPWVSVGPGWAAGWCSQPILWIAGAGSALPSATWEWAADAPGVAVVGVGSLALGALLMVALRRPWGGCGLVLLVLVAAFVRPVPLGWPGPWQAVFCDVGQGDATAIRAGPGAAALIDAGPEAAPVLACLDALAVTQVPLLVLTHYHADHVGGAEELIGRYRPSLVLVRAGHLPGWLVDACASAGSQLRVAVAGEVVGVGEVEWTSVASHTAAQADASEVEGSLENDASVVGIAQVGGLRILLPGDIEPAGQARALREARRAGIDLRVHVLKLPHHGSARQDARFFRASGAQLAVASAGRDNDYGHPAAAALSLSAEAGMAVARTDEDGSIAVSLAGEQLLVRRTRA